MISAPGGKYRLCWCSGANPCSRNEAFNVDVGEFTLVGPAIEQSRTCVAGETCAIRSIPGQDLSNADRMALLDTCGRDDLVWRAPQGGRMNATSLQLLQPSGLYWN